MAINPNIPASIPNTRISDRTRDREDQTKPGKEGEGKGSVAGNTGLFQRLPDTSEGGSSNSGQGNQGGGNTQIAQAINNLSGTQIARVSKDVVNRLTGRNNVAEVGGVAENISGVSTYGAGTLQKTNWMSNFSSVQGDRDFAPTTISAADQQLMANARTEARLNAGGVNPIVISRDRALSGNG